MVSNCPHPFLPLLLEKGGQESTMVYSGKFYFLITHNIQTLWLQRPSMASGYFFRHHKPYELFLQGVSSGSLQNLLEAQ